MTTKFTVHTGNPERRIEGFLEDKGLCYVSVFRVDDQEVVSFITKAEGEGPDGMDKRLEKDATTLEDYGYYDLETAST